MMDTKDASETGVDLDNPAGMALYGATLAAAFRYYRRNEGSFPMCGGSVISIDGKSYSLHTEIHEVATIRDRSPE